MYHEKALDDCTMPGDTVRHLSDGSRTSASGDGKKVLEGIAHETGGRMFEVSKKETTAQIYPDRRRAPHTVPARLHP